MEELIRLPTQLSSIIDGAVDAFLARRVKIQAHKRRYDADFWMICKDESAKGAEPAILTRRITIGAWVGSDDEELVFMPDIVVIKANGARCTLAPERRKEGAQRLSVFNLTRRLFNQKNEKQLEKEKKKIKAEIIEGIKSTWNTAKGFSIKDATELIP